MTNGAVTVNIVEPAGDALWVSIDAINFLFAANSPLYPKLLAPPFSVRSLPVVP